MELHEYIQNILDTKGISRGQLIKNTGLNSNYIYQILSGVKKLHVIKCLLYALH